MKISDFGLELIKAAEGLELKAYADTGGVPTIGYGHTSGVRLGQKTTQKQAEFFLKTDVESAEATVDKFVKVPIKQHEFDALVSFVFNVGIGQFMKSTLLRKLNKEDRIGAVNELDRWIYDNGRILLWQIKRRAVERELFKTGVLNLVLFDGPNTNQKELTKWIESVILGTIA